MDEIQRPFAQWLDATMRQRGLSQAAVAREVGVADAQVSRWRRGQVTPSVRYLDRLASTFDVPRANLEQMAGYPGGEPDIEIDPRRAAEMESYQARLRQLMEQRLPPELWSTYIDACQALAERLGASFQEVAEAAETQVERSARGTGHMGFRR
jgi:transcriptional regulator with XRE-family HTH domain